MRIDAHFARGRGHPVCQDYATTGPRAAVVCDGCSSAPDSDIGARLLAHAALQASPTAIDEGAWLSAPATARRSLGLLPGALDATCILARASDDAIEVTMLGDGVVAARHADGSLALIEVGFPECAPPYPSYTLDAERLHAYRDAGLGEPTVCATPGAPRPTTGPGWLRWTFPRSAWTEVLIGSDGLAAFRTGDHALAPVAEIIDALFRYPSPRGAFVTRRLRKFLAKEAPARNLTPEDDVAIAALCWESSR